MGGAFFIIKKCNYCGKTKSVSEFYKKRNSYESVCKKCKYEKTKKNHHLICQQCKKGFYTSKKSQKFCSRECRAKNDRCRVVLECEICGKKIEKIKSTLQRNKHHYCSNKCRAIGVGLYQSGKNNPNYKNATIKMDCSYCKNEFNILTCNLKNSDGSKKKNIYCSVNCKSEHQKEILKNENNPNYQGGGIQYQCDYCGIDICIPKYKFYSEQQNFYCSMECKANYQKTSMIGENNPYYIHGLSDEHRNRHRLIAGYNTWRINVFERDNYTCQICGYNKGALLNAHHLDGYNWCIKRRTDLDNGVTLCEICHTDFHSKYGFGNNTEEQFNKYIKGINNESA